MGPGSALANARLPGTTEGIPAARFATESCNSVSLRAARLTRRAKQAAGFGNCPSCKIGITREDPSPGVGWTSALPPLQTFAISFQGLTCHASKSRALRDGRNRRRSTMKTILVPTENTKETTPALEVAVLLARRCGAYIE